MNKNIVKIQERSRTDLGYDEVDGHLLVGERMENLGVVGGGSCWSSQSSRTAPLLKKQSWGCRMETVRTGRSTREGTIYRTKWARVNLTYLFAVSVKSEDTQVDMVTVRTVIKGLRR